MNGWVLLTGAVNPDPRLLGSTRIVDPASRLEEYRVALDDCVKISRALGMRVVFVETSGAKPEQLAAGRDVLWHSFRPTGKYAEYALRGKGAVEAAALDSVLREISPEPHDRLVKLTGRLRIANWQSLVGEVSSNSTSVRRTLDRRFVDSRFFTTDARFWWAYLGGMGAEVMDSEGKFLEHVLAKRLIDAEYAGEPVCSFSSRPLLIGRSGSTGRNYTMSRQQFGAAADLLLSPVLRRISDKQR